MAVKSARAFIVHLFLFYCYNIVALFVIVAASFTYFGVLTNQTSCSVTMTSFLKKHTLVYVIETVTPDYYLFKGYIDGKKNHQPIQTATMRMAEKTSLTSNTLFEYIRDTPVIRKQHFTGISKYALMYVYGQAGCIILNQNFPMQMQQQAVKSLER